MQYKQDFYSVKNKEKYQGDLDKGVVYRSSWELKFMEWLDDNKVVKYWNSEEIKIPYEFPKGSGKIHRYFVDFYVELIDGNKYLIEVKPLKYQSVDRILKDKSELVKFEYLKNQAKWFYAGQYAKKYGMRFCVLSEDNLQRFTLK